jgi:hypothetical protein
MLDPAKGVDKLHLLNGVTRDFEKSGTSEHNGQAPRAADRYIEAVTAVEKLDIARHVIARRGPHGD